MGPRIDVTTLLDAGFHRIPGLGRQRATVADLLRHRLRPSTVAQYGNTVSSFVTFLHTEGITTSLVNDTVIARYIAWMWAHDRYDLHPNTLRSYLSAVRKLFGPLATTPLDLQNPLIQDLLVSYTNDYNNTHDARARRPAWPASATIACASDLRDWLDGSSTMTEADAVQAAQLVFAALTYSRGNTSRHVLFKHISLTSSGPLVNLVTQKSARMRNNPPIRLLHGNNRNHPANVLADFVRRRRATFPPNDLVFRTTDDPAVASLDEAVKSTARRLNLGDIWSGHCIRIGAISAAFRIGVPIETIAELVGHAATATTRGYIRHDYIIDNHAVTLYGADRPGG